MSSNDRARSGRLARLGGRTVARPYGLCMSKRTKQGEEALKLEKEELVVGIIREYGLQYEWDEDTYRR